MDYLHVQADKPWYNYYKTKETIFKNPISFEQYTSTATPVAKISNLIGCLNLPVTFFFLFDSLRPSQQSFSYVGMGLLGLNQY